MIANEQIRTIATDLLTKTNASALRWWPDITSDSGRVVHLPHSRVRIAAEENEPPLRRLTLENASWDVVGEWIVHPGEDGFELLESLHRAAWDNSRRPDLVLKDLQGT